MKLCITKGKKICFYFLLLSTCTNFAKQMAKQKTYVVFVGRNPGIYDSWDECKMMTDNFPGAKFKAFSNRTEAILAYREREDDADRLLRTISEHLKKEEEARPDVTPVKTQNTAKSYPPEVVLDSIAVDAGCQGNPGRMDYRGVYVRTGKEIFHVGPYPNGTNNIGEFLAINGPSCIVCRNDAASGRVFAVGFTCSHHLIINTTRKRGTPMRNFQCNVLWCQRCIPIHAPRLPPARANSSRVLSGTRHMR